MIGPTAGLATSFSIPVLGMRARSVFGIWAEIDMTGNVVRSYRAPAMGLDSIHHELSPEPSSSDDLALSSELRDVPGYPTADGGTTTYAVVGNVIDEFDEDGGVLGHSTTATAGRPPTAASTSTAGRSSTRSTRRA